MTNRAKTTTIVTENEIEKCREESNWSKLMEIAETLKNKPDYEFTANFLLGEARLEAYLEEWPPIEANVNRAKFGLIEARRNLQIASSEGEKTSRALDAELLLGKLYYAWGQYEESLKHFNTVDLHSMLNEKLPSRNVRIAAESLAIKGLDLQKDDKPTTKFKKAEKEEEILKCFVAATTLAFLYMQEVDRPQYTNTLTTGSHSPQPPVAGKSLSLVLEKAIQEAPALLLAQGKPGEALERYRSCLIIVEPQGLSNLRLKLFCQMAEMLLQGTAYEEYKPPVENVSTKDSKLKPKVYKGLNLFVPKNECEETLLILLIAESIAVRNAVLSQSPEFKEARLGAFRDAEAVYDLLTIATVRWGQTSLLQESLERALKFSFNEPHIWRQYGYSMITTGNYNHAYLVLKEVIRLEPNSSIVCLTMAKLCYENLELPIEGTEFSKEGLQREQAYPSGILGRCYLYVGIGYMLQANVTLLKQNKQEFSQLAEENLRKAVEIEPNDYLCAYYLGLQLAFQGEILEALHHVNVAWALHPEHSSILHLLTLLLSADSQHDKALDVVNVALEEFPDNLNLMYVKTHLELHEEGGEKALVTAKKMMELWKVLYEGQISSDVPECDRKSETRSLFQLYPSEMSDKDSSSLRAQSVVAAKIEQALSEAASTLSSFNPKSSPQRASMLLLEIWLLLGEIYLSLGQVDDVQQCIQEASQIYSMSHHIMHMKGLLHMYKEEWPEAKFCFQNAVAINPQHIKSLQQLGLVYHYLGLQGLAEMTLREAAKCEPNNHITWYIMGKVLETLEECDTASSAMNNALTVERIRPILPFSTVPLCFE